MNTLKVGDKVPAFSAKDENGNIIKLSDYKGKKLIVFFYPKASTPGCTAEACNLRDNYTELKEQGYQFPFPLLADEDHTILNIFGVWGPKQFMGKKYDGIHRMTFVIDGDGVVEKVIDKVKTKDHAAQIL